MMLHTKYEGSLPCGLVNEKYAHRPEPICPRYLIRDIKIEEILGAKGTSNEERDYELPGTNHILFDVFQ